MKQTKNKQTDNVTNIADHTAKSGEVGSNLQKNSKGHVEG